MMHVTGQPGLRIDRKGMGFADRRRERYDLRKMGALPSWDEFAGLDRLDRPELDDDDSTTTTGIRVRTPAHGWAPRSLEVASSTEEEPPPSSRRFALANDFRSEAQKALGAKVVTLAGRRLAAAWAGVRKRG